MIRTWIDKTFLRTPAGIALLAVTGVVLLWTLFATLRPLPSRDLAMATGPPGSVFAAKDLAMDRRASGSSGRRNGPGGQIHDPY